jgi:hypothetical protein
MTDPRPGAMTRLDRRLVPGLVRRPEILFLLIGALFLASGAVRNQLLTAEREADDRPVEVVTIGPEAPEIGGGELTGDALLVGPGRGVDVARYVADRDRALTSASEAEPRAPTVAIASFDRYLTPAQAQEVIATVPVRAFAARFRLPVDDPFAEDGVAQLTRGRVAVDGEGTADGGIVDVLLLALLAEAEAAEAQADELESLVETADDPEFAEAFRRDRNRLRAAAALVGSEGCACVYAVEVQGALEALAGLAGHADVRLVDIAPPGVGAGAVTFAALLPEERGTRR